MIIEMVREAVHDPSCYRRSLYSSNGLHKNDACSKQQPPDHCKRDHWPGTRAQNDVRPLLTQDLERFPKIEKELPVTFGMSDEIRLPLHIHRKHGFVVQYVEIVMLLIDGLKAPNFSEVTTTG